MAGEGHLGGAIEDPHARGVSRVRRRQDERCLAQVELEGERLHLRLGKAAAVGEDGQRIAAEALLGEDVDGFERV
ncbi:hypothetical protein DSM104635_02645 [Terricaulis silvestris]|uniref:Uncharacterized protein n=1 Tax=Terricaulis silvestris TaxID=2686094 RepID=A0A6I6MTC2_9CAUL|nr:hypothetical protein [Terricaulis silvestris]QGZ95794.1 hypothetical protein DSM104635_02645 [Terricaulis silvestris]